MLLILQEDIKAKGNIKDYNFFIHTIEISKLIFELLLLSSLIFCIKLKIFLYYDY
jgi:hypothetical protein